MATFLRWLRVASVMLVTGLLLPATAVAADRKGTDTKTPTTNPGVSQAVTRSYGADNSVQMGMFVKLKDKDAGTIEAQSQKNVDKILGIVIPANTSAVTLTPEKINQQQLFVATTGRYNALVSNQNGAIKTGDFIVISAIAGVGMKADDQQSVAVGKAAAGFNGTSNVISTVKLKNATGKELPITVGRIPVELVVSNNPLQSKPSDYLPSFLVSAATAVSSKPVSAARIFLSIGILVVVGFITAIVIYSGVRSGMMAVGRNPLSKKSIIKSLVQTVAAGMIIFIGGVFAVYLLLKL